MEKDDLFKAGLGEKEICFNLDMEADSFRQVLFDHYQIYKMVADLSFSSVMQILANWKNYLQLVCLPQLF